VGHIQSVFVETDLFRVCKGLGGLMGNSWCPYKYSYKPECFLSGWGKQGPISYSVQKSLGKVPVLPVGAFMWVSVHIL
jgi:hypothetical protein